MYLLTNNFIVRYSIQWYISASKEIQWYISTSKEVQWIYFSISTTFIIYFSILRSPRIYFIISTRFFISATKEFQWYISASKEVDYVSNVSSTHRTTISSLNQHVPTILEKGHIWWVDMNVWIEYRVFYKVHWSVPKRKFTNE